MMSLAQAQNRAVENVIGDLKDTIRKIDKLIADCEVFSVGEIDCLNIVKQNLKNRITVYEAAICNVH